MCALRCNNLITWLTQRLGLRWSWLKSFLPQLEWHIVGLQWFVFSLQVCGSCSVYLTVVYCRLWMPRRQLSQRIFHLRCLCCAIKLNCWCWHEKDTVTVRNRPTQRRRYRYNVKGEVKSQLCYSLPWDFFILKSVKWWKVGWIGLTFCMFEQYVVHILPGRHS